MCCSCSLLWQYTVLKLKKQVRANECLIHCCKTCCWGWRSLNKGYNLSLFLAIILFFKIWIAEHNYSKLYYFCYFMLRFWFYDQLMQKTNEFQWVPIRVISSSDQIVFLLQSTHSRVLNWGCTTSFGQFPTDCFGVDPCVILVFCNMPKWTELREKIGVPEWKQKSSIFSYIVQYELI